MRIRVRSLTVAVVACGLAAGVGTSQHTTTPAGIPTIPINVPPPTDGNDSSTRQIELRQARMRNEERQKRLVADTDKLLVLATELHADVARTDKNMLSVEVIRRADEIERLAHAVKERERN